MVSKMKSFLGERPSQGAELDAQYRHYAGKYLWVFL